MKIFAAAILATALMSPARLRAETHQFIPTSFYNTYSFAHPPALRIKPGDRVVTKTIDAGGVDWNGKSVASGGNPETGPFFIEGAEPGDTIVVSIEKLETNRTSAYASSLLAPYTVDPQAIAARIDRDPTRTTWTIDKARGVVRLDQVEMQPGGIELPLKPMLGCVGVAPARKEAIGASVPGAFGGNMDYASMGAGMKLTLPVNEPGALLFLGDGHARMGEGEVVGTGLETSMDVGLSGALWKKKGMGGPPPETDTHVMVLGSARPLLEAFQHATTELQKMLVSDYGLSERGAQILMGQAAEYEIANVVDPSFTVVAKIRKTVLPRRTPAAP